MRSLPLVVTAVAALVSSGCAAVIAPSDTYTSVRGVGVYCETQLRVVGDGLDVPVPDLGGYRQRCRQRALAVIEALALPRRGDPTIARITVERDGTVLIRRVDGSIESFEP